MNWLWKLASAVRHHAWVAFVGESPRTFFDLAAVDLRPVPDEAAAVLRCYEARPDLRAAFPLGLTPAGRGGFLLWVLKHGDEVGVTAGGALAALLGLNARRDRGLVHTYRVQPAWQAAHPDALTPAGWGPFRAWVAREYGCPGRWLRGAELAGCDADSPPAPDVRGVNMIAPWRYVSGLREEALRFAEGLESLGWQVSKRATPAPPVSAGDPPEGFLGFERFPVTVVKAGALEPFDATFANCGLHPRSGVYRVAAWSWELEDFPAEVLANATLADEFWTPSEFGAVGLRQAVTDRPVVVMPPAVAVPEVRGGLGGESSPPHPPLASGSERPPPRGGRWGPTGDSTSAENATSPTSPTRGEVGAASVNSPAGWGGAPTPNPTHPWIIAPLPRSHFGLPDGRTLFLFTFDLSGVLERKNPLGLIAAFRRAFGPDAAAHLVLKVNRAEAFPAEFAAIRAACAGLNVTLLTGVLPPAELFALLNLCDSYVSLHRAEGFGFTVAEAMLMGKPVIATDYSATAEFVSDETGLPVRMTVIELDRDYGPYRAGRRWADPDLDHAAERMRWVSEHPAEAKHLGERGKAFAEVRFNPAAAARRVAARVAAILSGGSGSARRTPGGGRR